MPSAHDAPPSCQCCSRDRWETLLDLFDDANIYQAWSYGAIRWGRRQLRHIVLGSGSDIVAAAQIRLITVPALGGGIAYLPFGPLWKRKGRGSDEEAFYRMIELLRDAYVTHRGLLLRVLPRIWNDGSGSVSERLAALGLTRVDAAKPYRTLLIDLSMTQDALRKGLNAKWRGHLNQSERAGLMISAGSDDARFASFADIYAEMHARKRFAEGVSIEEIRAVQTDLPERHKMRVFVASHDGEPVAAEVCSAMGDTGVSFLAATNDHGRRCNAAYAVKWAAIAYLQQAGCRWYDLGGIDAQRDPGTYSFKTGLAGRTGRAVEAVGQYDACSSFLSSCLVGLGEGIRRALRRHRNRSAADAGDAAQPAAPERGHGRG